MFIELYQCLSLHAGNFLMSVKLQCNDANIKSYIKQSAKHTWIREGLLIRHQQNVYHYTPCHWPFLE